MPPRWVSSASLAFVLYMPTGHAEAAFHFSDPTTFQPASNLWSTAIADFDGDGRNDVATLGNGTPEGRTLFIYFTKASGGFEPVVKVKGLFHTGIFIPLVARDLNDDDRAEIVIGHAKGIVIVHVDAARHVTSAQARGPASNLVSFGDFNEDGVQDVVSDAAFYDGNAQGGIANGVPFRLKGVPQPIAMAVGNTNFDRRDDLIVADGLDGYVFAGVEGGFSTTPQTLHTEYQPWSVGGIAAADFNHDGRIDVTTDKVSNSPTTVSVFYQDAVGAYPARIDLGSLDIPGEMLSYDVDVDGLIDLTVMHEGWGDVGVYFQSASGLADEVLYPSASSDLQTGMALGDLNGDGCTDIAVASTALGLQIRYGQECAVRDLSVTVALTTSTATIRADNRSLDGMIGQATVAADVSIRSGSLQLTSLPDNCVQQAVSTSKIHVDCLVEAIEPGQAAALPFGFQAGPKVIGNRITITASAKSVAKDPVAGNNSASQWIDYWPLAGK